MDLRKRIIEISRPIVSNTLPKVSTNLAAKRGCAISWVESNEDTNRSESVSDTSATLKVSMVNELSRNGSKDNLDFALEPKNKTSSPSPHPNLQVSSNPIGVRSHGMIPSMRWVRNLLW